MSSEELEKYINKILNEATSESGSRGSYVSPLVPGTKDFDKSALAPFNNPVSEYNNALLAYDSYDNKMDVPKKVRKELETKSRKITNYLKKHPSLTSSDDDGNIINQTPGKGKNIVPVNEWIEVTDELLNEDLAVWFGTKKKPKGSKQPKGPWVNICRKKEGGGHPPCGRPEAKDKGYPKCRAAGVAARMSDSQKKAACAQKRRAEKTNPKGGTGNKPKMVSYKPRTNESLDRLIRRTLREQLSTATTYSSVTPKSSGTFNCVPSSVKPLVEYIKKNKNDVMSKLGVDNSKLIMFLKAAIGIIGRESSFENSIRYDLKKVAAMFGLGDSYGPAQMTKKTWDELDIDKKFNLSDDSLFEVVGAGLAAMLYLKNAYDKAISAGYTSDKTTNIEGTGNSALDISIGSYNAGTDKIVKYCKSPNDKLAHVCKSGEKSFVVNYLPNFPTNKWYTGELTTHGYVKEVASYYKKYNCLDSI